MKNVVIWGTSNYNWLWVPLAKEIKRKHGANIHFICTDSQSIAYWENQDREGVIDSFTTTSNFFSNYDHVEETTEQIYGKAQQYEEKYKTFVVDILQTDRHLGRGFFAGGIGHPKSHLSEKANYLRSVNFCNRAFAFWEEFFEEKQVDLVIGLASAVLGKTCTVVARARGIRVRDFFRANYGAYHGWAFDEYYSLCALKEKYQSIDNTIANTLVSDEELVLLKRTPFTDQYYKDFTRGISLRMIAKRIVRQCRWYVYRRYKGILRGYLFRESIRVLWRMRTELKELMKYEFVNETDLTSENFVLFPLHVEPETSVGMQSPEMNEQLACIELLAKNLPAGVRLVVKEHLAAVGRRPRDFYSTIAEIPNVLMLSPYACAVDVARNARAVATITSTLGMEAAVLGIPIISFGLHNNYNIIPHVRVIESWVALRALFIKLCGQDSEEEKKKRREDGRRYLAAVKRCCIDLSWTDYASKDRPSATAKEVEVIYGSLISSLKHDVDESTNKVTNTTNPNQQYSKHSDNIVICA